MYEDVREMAITHQDFFRLLPKAIVGRDYQREGTKVLIEDGDKRVVISLSEESTRKIASLVLPLTCVTVQIEGFSESEQKTFLDRFYLAYQKGGG